MWFYYCVFVVYKQKTAYELRISDWSSDVCSSDLTSAIAESAARIDQQCGSFVSTLEAMNGEVAGSSTTLGEARDRVNRLIDVSERVIRLTAQSSLNSVDGPFIEKVRGIAAEVPAAFEEALRQGSVTEPATFDEPTAELQSLMRI